MTTKWTTLLSKFHRDEEGLEALQVVMIIAIAAMILLAAATVGKQGVDWMTGQTGNIIDKDLSAFGAGGGDEGIEIEE
jgi:hypothetical protein